MLYPFPGQRHKCARARSLNFVLLETFLDLAAQLTTHCILFARPGLDQHQIFDFPVTDAIDARHLNIAHDVLSESRVMAHLLTDLFQQCDYFSLGSL